MIAHEYSTSPLQGSRLPLYYVHYFPGPGMLRVQQSKPPSPNLHSVGLE